MDKDTRSAMDIPSRKNLADLRPITSTLDAADVIEALRSALLDIHRENANDPISFPSAQGAFPDAFFVPPLPVVPDANILHDDILYACRHDQRTVLVNAANSQLLRLFCAQHVVGEVVEHIEDWTDESGVSPTTFRRRWMSEYLPVIRVVPSQDITTSLLTPEEIARIDELVPTHADDVPSATLALVLEAFYLSKDLAPLRAVYGGDADLTAHDQWLDTLKAGGDAGQLGRMFHIVLALLLALGAGVSLGVKRLVTAIGPWSLVPLALSALAVKYTSHDAKLRIKSAAISTGSVFFHTYAAYQEVLARFQQATPPVPTWEQLATTNNKDAVLLRACLHTLARSGMSDRSAHELALELPFLGVARGEAKVRHILRAHDAFHEVWRGRWQVGQVAQVLRAQIDQVPEAGQ